MLFPADGGKHHRGTREQTESYFNSLRTSYVHHMGDLIVPLSSWTIKSAVALRTTFFVVDKLKIHSSLICNQRAMFVVIYTRIFDVLHSPLMLCNTPPPSKNNSLRVAG